VDQRKFTSQKYELKYTWLYFSHANNGYMQGSRCWLPMSQFAIFFLDWRLKLAAGDFFAA
jgi:hypothetical protein